MNATPGQGVARPLLSILTPTLNRAEFICDAIESVLEQGYEDFEHIVVDGGSTDGTLDVLAEYDHLRVVSEPDDGLYDALNKGIRLSRGSLIGHLNSDDLYLPGTFRKVVDAFEGDPTTDSVAGGAEIVEEAAGRPNLLHVFDDDRHRFPDMRTITRGAPIINARFFARSFYERVGVYDARFSIVADRDLLLRGWLAGMSTRGVPGIVYRYRQHGESLTFGGDDPLPMIRDALALSEKWIHDAPNALVRQECRRWRARQYGRLVSALARLGRWSESWDETKRGLRDDLAWPLRFAGARVSERVRKELAARSSTN